MRKAVAKPETTQPVLPSPLEEDDIRVLRWIGERPRECAVTPPAGFQFGHMSACRRKLLRQGLVTLDCPPGLPCVYLLTAEGEKLLAEMVKVAAETRAARKKRLSKGRAKRAA